MREFLRQGVVYGASSVVLAAVELVATPILTRLFDTHQYGTRELIANGIAFIMPLTFLGLDFSFPAEYHAERSGGRGRALLSTSFLTVGVWATLVATTVAILNLVLFQWPSAAEAVAFGVAAVSAAPAALLLMTKWALRFRFQPRTYAVLAVFGALGSTGLGLVGAAFTRDVLGFFLGQLIGLIFAALLGIFALRDDLALIADFRKLVGLVRLGLPFMPATLASLAFLYVDRQILGALDAVSAVGVYALGWRIAGVSALAVLVLSTTWLPIALREFPDREAFRKLTSDAMVYSVLTVGFLAVSLTITAPELVWVLAPPSFAAAALVVPPLTFAAVFQALATIASASVFISRRPLIGVAANLAAFVANALVAVVAVPRWGSVGAALGVLVGYVVLATWYGVAFRATIPIRALPVAKVSRVIVLTAVALGVALILMDSTLAVRALVLAAYVGALVMTGAIGRREYQVVGELLSRRLR